MSHTKVLVVGGGFAGFHAARTVSRKAADDVEVTLLNPTDYFLYLPLLPEVAAGVLEPRRITVSLATALPRAKLVLGEATTVDTADRTVTYRDPEGGTGRIGYDRLVLAVGGVNKLLPIPGVAEHAHGFRGIPEAVYLRDHIIRQIEQAATTDDPAERTARTTFVVVGAGYTGTEVAAQGQLFSAALARRRPRLAGQPLRWMLLDQASEVLPELDPRLSRTADRVLRRRGVEVRMGTSIEEATADGVRLTDGQTVPTRTLVWSVGVRADPFIEGLGLRTQKGRLVVDEHLAVPGHPEILACGDAAAVPDLTRPGETTAMTAQHAERQGRLAGHNLAAALGHGERRAYRHHDLGFVVDLAGVKAAANPFGLPLSGIAAKAVTRGYHLASMPGNRIRTGIDWAAEALLRRQSVQLGLVRGPAIPLDTASPELPRHP